MTRTHTNRRRAEKKSSARAAVRMLRKAGYTWANGTWQAPYITLTVRPCDMPKLRAELSDHQRMQRYVDKYNRKSLGLLQIAEPGQSTGGCKP